MFLARYADPNAVLRLGQARLTRFLQARSRGHYGWDQAQGTDRRGRGDPGAVGPTRGEHGMDFAELATDIAAEAEQAPSCTAQIKDIDERSQTSTPRPTPKGSSRPRLAWAR